MKKIFPIIIIALCTLFSPAFSKAQYYEIANQLPQLISPALSGSMNYKGFVDASFLKGVGSNQADILDFSTSQGFTYSTWFYMGVGLGVDIIFAHTDDDWGNGWNNDPYRNHETTTTGVMIPLFSDFRFNIGGSSSSSPSFYIDLRIGASFLIGQDYIRINNGYLTSNEHFYLRPSIGVRIPINKEKPKQAINIGIDYQLLTSNYWNNWNNNVTLNAFGVNAAFEW
ncbi:MAG: hypothetical protein NC201_03475 [Prevotella sp.]|nr:hypothetical protein [Bacteroides sp.]MCM1366288.1 hypothetical protein [Prevotella sp.]MCM1437092.1 hypothetical protein [Prevotella sp.]